MRFFEEKNELSKKFREYLRYGSFPQTLELYDTPEEINTYLDGVYTSVLYKDVINRKGITDKGVLESITQFLYDNIGNLCSIKKISDTLTSNGRSTSNHTVENYVNALIDSFLLYRASRYDVKGKELLKTQEKYYAIDIGLRYYLLGQQAGNDLGHILENIVYLELLRRGYKVYVGKVDEVEVDFVAKNTEDTIYYQVSASVRDENTLKRELEPLKRINDKNLMRLWNWYDIGCTDDILSIIDKEFRNRYVNNMLHSNVKEFIFHFGDFKTADMWINEPWKLAEFK